MKQAILYFFILTLFLYGCNNASSQKEEEIASNPQNIEVSTEQNQKEKIVVAENKTKTLPDLIKKEEVSSTAKEEKVIQATQTEEIDTETKVKVDKPISITKQDFLDKIFNYEKNKDWKYKGDLPCLVDFWATWCGPCRRVAPILDELAKEYAGKIYIYKVNTDIEKELSAAFRITSIPTFLICPKEGQPQVAQGALPKESFVQMINEVLLKNNKTN